MMKNKKFKEMKPWFRKFKGTIDNDSFDEYAPGADEFKTLEEYLKYHHDGCDSIFIKVFHRKNASVSLSLNEDIIDDYEAIIVHDNGAIQVYPSQYEDKCDAGDLTEDFNEWFDYEDVEFGGCGYCDTYLLDDGNLYDITLIKV